MPKAWYNVRADMKTKPAPLLNPGTHEPMKAEELAPVFCEELIAQELDNENANIPIPQEILDFYKMYRPSPLVRAYCLEEKLQTPAKIYYKFEGNNSTGSHKLNAAIAHAYYAKKQVLKVRHHLIRAPDRWATAHSMASLFRLDCKLFMLKDITNRSPTGGRSCAPRRVPRPVPGHGTAVGKDPAEHPGPTAPRAAPTPSVYVATSTEVTAMCRAAC
jgi:tryptophan synthase beta chain